MHTSSHGDPSTVSAITAIRRRAISAETKAASPAKEDGECRSEELAQESVKEDVLRIILPHDSGQNWSPKSASLQHSSDSDSDVTSPPVAPESFPFGPPSLSRAVRGWLQRKVTVVRRRKPCHSHTKGQSDSLSPVVQEPERIVTCTWPILCSTDTQQTYLVLRKLPLFGNRHVHGLLSCPLTSEIQSELCRRGKPAFDALTPSLLIKASQRAWLSRRASQGRPTDRFLGETATFLRLADLPAHANVMSTADILEDEQWMYLVMPYADGGDLFGLVESTGSGLSEEQARGCFRQIVRGLLHLKQSGLTHGDVSLENIVLSSPLNTSHLPEDDISPFHCRLIDFEVTRSLHPPNSAYDYRRAPAPPLQPQHSQSKYSDHTYGEGHRHSSDDKHAQGEQHTNASVDGHTSRGVHTHSSEGEHMHAEDAEELFQPLKGAVTLEVAGDTDDELASAQQHETADSVEQNPSESTGEGSQPEETGLAEDFKATGDQCVFGGKNNYMAPEFATGKVADWFATDIWSLGICLYIMLTGCPLYEDMSDPAFTIAAQGRVADVISYYAEQHGLHIEPAAQALVVNMLKADPAARLTLEEVANDPWLTGA